MSKLFDQKYQRNDAVTENGMPTHSSSGSYVADLFFKMGASRNLSEGAIESLLINAWGEDPNLTVKAVFYNRDIRGGQGERRSFRIFLKWMAHNQLEVLIKNIHLVPEYGRWDDVYIDLLDIDPRLNEAIHGLIWNNLVTKPNKLLAKWMPRENKKYHDYALYFMKAFGLSPEQYRGLLVRNTEVVETLMCQKRWEDIKYQQVPSVAMNKLRKAFSKHDPTRFTAWIQDVKSGKSKVNASAIFPHDIVKKAMYERVDNADAIQIQWDALPNYIEGGKQILPICDVSGSMAGEPMTICVALGIYLAERNEGLFHNEFITFSTDPKFQVLKGKNLVDKIQQLFRSDWGMSTDIEKVFATILSRARGANLDPADMPDTLLILSDMQFNACTSGTNHNALDMMRAKYETAGYKLPNIIFWNLRSSSGVPAKVNEDGVALVSGFSPSILKQVLSEDLSPMGVVIKTLTSERYALVTL